MEPAEGRRLGEYFSEDEDLMLGRNKGHTKSGGVKVGLG